MFRSVRLSLVVLVSALGVRPGFPATPLPFPQTGGSTVVAADGSGEFKSIQEAINAAPQLTDPKDPWTIHIRPGVYREQIYLMREKRFIHLVGDNPTTTIISEDSYAGMIGHDGQQIGTFRTPTVWIDADDFSVSGLTIANSAGAVGQAVALRVDGDRVSFDRCRFTGWQDTILVNRGRQYFRDCTITGAVDFIFGGATAYFDHCQIDVVGDGYVTAASTLPSDKWGLVFSHCTIKGTKPGIQTFLGRPWRAFASVTVVATEMDATVKPAGWDNWDRPDREKTCRYAEYGNTGPGAGPGGRVSWATRLTPEQAAAISPGSVLAGNDGWQPVQ